MTENKEEEIKKQEKSNDHHLKEQVKELEKDIKNLEKDNKELTEYNAKLEQKVDEITTKANQYLTTASYYKNELDNQKKDFERLKQRSKDVENDANIMAKENVIKKLLPILDTFEQAILKVSNDVMKGFKMIYDSMLKIVLDLGAEEINCENETLNPELHNCISVEKTDDEKLNDKVANVFQKGYIFAETKKVIRPATVSVYKN